jgi:hypothetical protein
MRYSRPPLTLARALPCCVQADEASPSGNGQGSGRPASSNNNEEDSNAQQQRPASNQGNGGEELDPSSLAEQLLAETSAFGTHVRSCLRTCEQRLFARGTHTCWRIGFICRSRLLTVSSTAVCACSCVRNLLPAPRCAPCQSRSYRPPAAVQMPTYSNFDNEKFRQMQSMRTDSPPSGGLGESSQNRMMSCCVAYLSAVASPQCLSHRCDCCRHNGALAAEFAGRGGGGGGGDDDGGGGSELRERTSNEFVQLGRQTGIGATARPSNGGRSARPSVGAGRSPKASPSAAVDDDDDDGDDEDENFMDEILNDAD